EVLKAIKVPDDPEQASLVFALRMRVQIAQGDAEAAADALEAALASDKGYDNRAMVSVCRNLASALDAKAVERDKAKDRVGAQRLWRRCVPIYVRAASGAPGTDVDTIAERLRTIGLILNDIDDTIET